MCVLSATDVPHSDPQLYDPHAALLAAHEAATFLSPIAFAKPFDALRGEVWVSDCDGMRVLCWGAFQP